MAWLMDGFKDLSKIAVGAIAVVAIPVAMVVNGGRVALKDNPDDVKGVSDNIEYNLEQFKEGLSLGFYEAKKPVPNGKTTQDLGAEAADAVVNAAEKGAKVAEKTAEETGNFLEGFFGRLKEKYDGSAVPPPAPETTATPPPAAAPAPAATTPAAAPPAANPNQTFVCNDECWERIRKQSQHPIPVQER